MRVLLASVLASAQTDGGGPSAGLLLLLLIGGLALALVVLYRSMRRQLKRIDFDPDGRSDAERMRRRTDTGRGEGADGVDGPRG